MKNTTSLMLLALLAIVGTMTISSAYAAHHLPLDVGTDELTYDHESTITVTGSVANVVPGDVVTIVVVSPLNSIVTIDQLNVSSDNTFKTTFNTSSGLWKYDGTYTIKVNYGSLDNKAAVELFGGVAVGTPSGCGPSEVDADGYCIPYEISGGEVTSATINTDDNSIIININPNDDGTLTVTPSESTQDGIFMVLVDGEESDDVEINGNTVTVMFPAEAEQIEIIGTFVIPEFGTIAAMILAVAIISIIAVSAKSRLSIMPRY
jgi:predicted secreted protein with PEFG-CTERM motif